MATSKSLHRAAISAHYDTDRSAWAVEAGTGGQDRPGSTRSPVSRYPGPDWPEALSHATHDSDPIPPPSPIAIPTGEAGTSPVVPVRPAALWALVLGAGVLVGIAAWLGGEASKSVIKPRLQEGTSRGRTIRVASRHDQAVADAKNAGLAFALLGGLLARGWAWRAGLARRSGRAADRRG